ncbi:MAG: DUF1731 domain-containing protein [Salinibacterium sp.]|nr:DUF1731 domain-containing protein [Salinibacterium sp.]
MTDRIVIAGASGFVGSYLASAYRARGADVKLIGRTGPDAAWGATAAITDLLDGADLLINMAGKSVNCRYGAANRAEIMRSRIDTTRELAAAVVACTSPPPLWINSSTATIYRHADDRPMTESTGEIGSGFSVGIATAWEHELATVTVPHTRKVALRMAIVLGDGSALVPLLRLVRFGLGGPQVDGPWFRTKQRVAAGTFHEFRSRRGRQRFSWIHIDDVLGIIDFLREHPELEGPVNASSPHSVDNVELMGTLRKVLRVPFGLPAPRPLLEIGTAIIRSETELVLKSRWVAPEKLLAAGYRFEYPHLEPAVRQIVGSRGKASHG